MKVKKFDNTEILLCRCGYTGEDGFEISIDKNKIEKFVDMLFKIPYVKPAGLAARDSLRLEAGLCLHGNDMDDKINPSEANLMWLVRKASN